MCSLISSTGSQRRLPEVDPVHYEVAACRLFEFSKSARAHLQLDGLRCTFEISEYSIQDHNSNFFCKVPVKGLYYRVLGKHSGMEGFSIVKQQLHNKLMHAMNGNTTLRLQWKGSEIQAHTQANIIQCLQAPFYHSTLHSTPLSQTSGSRVGIYEHTPITPSAPLNTKQDCIKQEDFFMSKLQLSREFMLSIRNAMNFDESAPQIATRFVGTARPATPVHNNPRTGRRIGFRNQEGKQFFKKRPKARRDWVCRIHGIKQSSRTPPPVGAPGSHFGTNKECAPQQAPAKVFSRGAYRRRLLRRAYRKWSREHKQACGQGVGSPNTAGSLPKKATQSRASWFRKSLYWQQHHVRRKKVRTTNYPTTTPISYGYRFRLATLHVQGFPDTLKLKNCIQLMKEHKLDVLFLTETKSQSYYTYTSEQHLVILSGNHLDMNAGVGAIIHPTIRPHLLDIIQVNPRLLHLSFKKKGGNIHLIGAYAPHAGLPFEEFREPFWDNLEQHLSRIPQPEPIYLTGDFNVRFQAQHKHDQGVTGPYTYGKGPRYIDHNAECNRSLCVTTMMLNNTVEVAYTKNP